MRRIIVIIILVYNSILTGQNINRHLLPSDIYVQALELFQDEKYHLAQKQFIIIIENEEQFTRDEIEGAYYYRAICAIELLNPDAEYYTSVFLNNYPSSGKTDQLKFEIGRYFYRKKDFSHAIDWLEKVNPRQIQNKDRDEFYFSSGYCHFENDSIEKARQKFYEIKDGKGIYSASALYYYSHINYTQKNYQTALEGFENLKKDTTFSSIVPYYISQIYFLQEKYTDLINYASDFLKEVTEKRKAEVARIIAESHFNLKQYKEAIPYYNIYTEYTSEYTEEDYYQSGYSYYKAEEYEKAAKLFEKISNNNSLLGQNASYHLADCYIKIEDKQKALIAFANASKNNFDSRIKEDALFNKAILNYELSISPFSEAIRDFEKYIEIYPNSARIDEAYNYLMLAYINSKNYKYALSSLEKISKPTDEVRKAYQHLAFFRGIELLTNGKYDEAVNKFDLSLQYGMYNRTLKALSNFWKGECFYRTGKYHEAILSFNEFILNPGAFQLKEYQKAHYNLGYCYFKTRKYNEALSWFRKFINFNSEGNDEMLADAYNRAGDISFLKNDYNNAISYYTGAANLKNIDADYALFQKGFAYGLLGNYIQKVNALEHLIISYNNSSHIDDALFEIAVSYQMLNDLDKAEGYLTKLINNYHGSNYEKSALVQLGLIYYNTNKTDKAISTYKKVISSYPGSTEAQSALKGLKNIYIEQNKVETYLAYVNNLDGQIKITHDETDSLLFVNAENIYFKGNCDKAVASLNDYISQSQNGPFIKTAYVYLADCYNQQGRKDEAIRAYNKVLELPGMEFREQSLLELSRINYSMEKYESALANYFSLEKITQSKNNLLEANLGKMRCQYKLKSYEETVVTAKEVLKNEKLDPVFIKEANYLIAKSYFELKEYDNAQEAFKNLAKNLKTVEGAEAKFRIAEIYFKKNKLDKSEEEIYEYIKENTPHQFWMAKSYLLLAEIFIKKKDYFQASHTVQSIIDYYEDKEDGIITAAREIKDKIIEMEKKVDQNESNELELHLENN